MIEIIIGLILFLSILISVIYVLVFYKKKSSPSNKNTNGYITDALISVSDNESTRAICPNGYTASNDSFSSGIGLKFMTLCYQVPTELKDGDTFITSIDINTLSNITLSDENICRSDKTNNFDYSIPITYYSVDNKDYSQYNGIIDFNNKQNCCVKSINQANYPKDNLAKPLKKITWIDATKTCSTGSFESNPYKSAGMKMCLFN